MKKISICMMTVILSLTFIPALVKAEAAVDPTSAPISSPAEAA